MVVHQIAQHIGHSNEIPCVEWLCHLELLSPSFCILEIITYNAILSNVKQKDNMVQVSKTFSCNGIEIDITTAWCEDICRAS